MTGLVALFEMQVSPKQEAAKEEKQKIFAFNSDRVQFFTVKTPEKILTFERVYATKGGKSSWEMKLPVQAHASQASVDFLLDRLATGKMPVKRENSLFVEQARKPVHKRLIENGAISRSDWASIYSQELASERVFAVCQLFWVLLLFSTLTKVAGRHF